MARIIFTDGRQIHDLKQIQATLAPLNVSLRYWPVPTDTDSQSLLAAKALDDSQKTSLLQSVNHYFDQLKDELGYTTRDMIVLHEDIPGLSDLLAKFESIHTHADDEVRYILAGKGYFGFVTADGEQFLVEVNAGDYINVPANAEHWFTLGDSSRIKAVRYFIDTSGWVPEYTQRQIQFTPETLPWSAATAD
ncbi:MAG: cupin domain-containing protein [Gammaproteobacteria bacterium]|nr:cupin domain-containing protein [Gammaproteobacteria bacterium]